MIHVSTQELLPALGGIRVPVRIGRLAGADGDLLPQRRLGSDHTAAGNSGRNRSWISAVEAQEGHQILRKGEQ